MQNPLCYKLMSNLNIAGRKFSNMDLPSKGNWEKVVMSHKKQKNLLGEKLIPLARDMMATTSSDVVPRKKEIINSYL